MSIAPTAPAVFAWAERAYDAAMAGVTGLFGRREEMGFAPDQVLGTTPGIDPHFIPRAPMSNANLDMGLLAKLSHEGVKRAKEITPQTHPALHRVWVEMCHRAGLQRIPQLLVGESRRANAASLHDENAVVMTTELMKTMNFREVTAVLGHEMGHEASDHTGPRVLATLVFGGGGAIVGDELARRGGIGSLVNFEKMSEGWFKKATAFLLDNGKKPLSFLGSAWYVIAGGWLGSIPARQLSVHPTELEADRKGAMISGDPEGLISALQKLEDHRAQKPGIWPAIKRGFRFITSGYPSTETRVAKLRHIAQTMPAGMVAAYTLADQPAMAAAQPTPVAEPAPELPSPAAQVTNVAGSQRVGEVSQAPAIVV